MATPLKNAVSQLYETFARYPRPEKIEVCTCCTPENATANLVTAPLRQLHCKDLADYAFSAISTQGSVDDFRYLLPRLLESIAEEAFACDPQILFGKLPYAEWTTWSSDEMRAIRNYLDALWKHALLRFPLYSSMPAFYEIEQVLCSIARTTKDLGPYLATWSSTQEKSADRHLIQFVTMHGADFAGGRTLNEAFWEDTENAGLTLRAWLLQPDTLQRIRIAAPLLPLDGFEHLFEPSLDVLECEAKTFQRKSSSVENS